MVVSPLVPKILGAMNSPPSHQKRLEARPPRRIRCDMPTIAHFPGAADARQANMPEGRPWDAVSRNTRGNTVAFRKRKNVGSAQALMCLSQWRPRAFPRITASASRERRVPHGKKYARQFCAVCVTDKAYSNPLPTATSVTLSTFILGSCIRMYEERVTEP
jgi:hypothetical protein